jgi:CheY-like chemotaxis protein
MTTRRVLTVDDDSAIRRLIRFILEFDVDNVEVLEASDGAQCIDIVRSEPVDLILLDLHMPGLNGWDVLRTLRSSLSSRAIPTIVVSAEQPDRRLVRELSPEGYIRKPFDNDELTETVKKHLRNGCTTAA